MATATRPDGLREEWPWAGPVSRIGRALARPHENRCPWQQRRASAMRVLICGWREWSDRPAIFGYVAELIDEAKGKGEELVVIEGECRGADLIAREAAEFFGVPVDPFPAAWEEQGRAAGVIRNARMLRDGRPDLVVAFHPWIERSKGTRDMVHRARAAHIPVRIIREMRHGSESFG